MKSAFLSSVASIEKLTRDDSQKKWRVIYAKPFQDIWVNSRPYLVLSNVHSESMIMIHQ